MKSSLPTSATRSGEFKPFASGARALILWCRPLVEEANHLGPAFARVFKETILVSYPDKPLPRAGKGTVQRKLALDLYADEIEKLYVIILETPDIARDACDSRYQTLEDSTDARGISPPRSWCPEDVEDWLLSHAASLNEGVAPPPDSEIFLHGFDRWAES